MLCGTVGWPTQCNPIKYPPTKLLFLSSGVIHLYLFKISATIPLLMPDSFVCTKCKKLCGVQDFRVRPDRTAGRRKECKTCESIRSVDRYYEKDLGVTREQIEKGKALRKGVCDLCGRVSTSLVADHCHETNQFRGFICFSENTALGKLGDNKEGLLRALRYMDSAGARFKEIKKCKGRKK